MTVDFAQLELRDWLVIGATIAGPILAVQAQKWLERFREHKGRKLWLFQQLMASRAARVSAEHVQALNMIDLVFYGSHYFGVHYRSKSEQAVVEAWREYHDHLNAGAQRDGEAVWGARLEELFINLLFAIAKDVRFKFDRVQLKRGAYTPQAHGELLGEQNQIRKMMVDLLAGNRALKMEVSSFPIDKDIAKAQMALHASLNSALTGSGALFVQNKQPEPLKEAQ